MNDSSFVGAERAMAGWLTPLTPLTHSRTTCIPAYNTIQYSFIAVADRPLRKWHTQWHVYRQLHAC